MIETLVLHIILKKQVVPNRLNYCNSDGDYIPGGTENYNNVKMTRK